MSPLYIEQISGLQFKSRLNSCKRKSNRYPDLHFTDIDYADDKAVIRNSLIDANKLLNKFEDTAKDIGLYINSENNENMCLNYENQINMKPMPCHDKNV